MNSIDLSLLEHIRETVTKRHSEGKVAAYIPALAQIDPSKFGICIAFLDGEIIGTGDFEEAFSIQSISKVFTLTMAMDLLGDSLWERMGREPSGTRFNSLVQLEHEHGIPRNPFINAGAIVLADILLEKLGHDALKVVTTFMQQRSENSTLHVNQEVYASEWNHGYRNRALANFIKSFGNLHGDPLKVLELYFSHCSIHASCKDLARGFLFLANSGVDPLSGKQILSTEMARRVKAIMLTCGHYDASGDFAFRVGLPGKSGVGGGIVAIVPGYMSIAVWSPPLNQNGNSHCGTLALEQLSQEAGLSIFA